MDARGAAAPTTDTAPRRVAGLTLRGVDDELIVHDERRHRTHALAPVAAAVFGAIDGQRGPAEIALVVGTAGPPLELDQVRTVVEDLARAGLVTHAQEPDLTRRTVLRVAGAGAAGATALTVVHSVLAPTVAAAQSAGDGGSGGGGGGGPVDPPPAPLGDVTTLAGGDQGFADGTGTAAQFFEPGGIAVGPGGTIYVADRFNDRIRAVSPAGTVTTLAGGDQGFADGTGTAAQFHYPSSLTVAPDGTLYVVDWANHAVRAVTPAGVVTTFVGGVQGSADGTGTAAQFDRPLFVQAAADGTLYVADHHNHLIRAVTPAGVVTTLAGSTAGAADGTGTAAQFHYPAGIVVTAGGTIYVADTANHRIRRITAGGVVTTLAGSTDGYADGTGSEAMFSNPYGLALGPDGTIYVADHSNHAIRMVTPVGVVTTLAGGSGSGSADGSGSAAQFDRPFGIAVGPSGAVYVTEFGNNRLRVIT